MRILLIGPEIAGNVGAVLRTSVCLGLPVDSIRDGKFPIDERALQRSARGHRASAEFTCFETWEEYRSIHSGRVILLSTSGANTIYETEFLADDILAFGSESKGAPEWAHAKADMCLKIPITSVGRSFNLSVSVAISASEALRQTASLPLPASREL